MKKLLLLSTSLTACTVFAPLALANPDDGVVSSGAATIENGINRVDIHQSSDRAVIDWRSFNINQGETTQFHQPSSSSLTVNRINDSNPSQILGTLQANGNLVLINQSGISFGAGSVVDVNSLIATSSDISNADAMAGNLNFQGVGQAGSAIINEGTITAHEAGLVGLVAPRVENNGLINARLGKVHLASGDRFTVDLYGDGALNITASDAVQEQLVSNSGSINAEGGVVQITAAAGAHLVSSVVKLDGEIKAPRAVQKNGRIIISGHDDTAVTITGSLDASGASGGDISITGKNILQQGKITANGTSGAGGTVDIKFKSAHIDNENSKVEAKGQGGDGGLVSVKGKTGSRAFVSGQYDVSSTTGKGGKAQITTDQGDLKLFGAKVRADGKTGGGTVYIGGEYQGSGSLEHALTTAINFSTVLSADATDSGKGGNVIVWSDHETRFGGNAYARGGVNGGDGGLIELSSKETLTISNAAETVAAARMAGYQGGQLLLDPKNITIATGGISDGISYFEMVDPNPDAGYFGNYNYRVLSNGNVVVGDPGDDLIANGAGAIYLFNGATGALISTATGARADDYVGEGYVMELTNGNYVVSSPNWDNGGTQDVGAVTWGSATTGISGTISTLNSFVGADAFQGGVKQMFALTNGNYVVRDAQYNNSRGAVAWGNGSGGTVGVMSAANSLVGTQANDFVGFNSVFALSNGNYMIMSPLWDNGGIADVGAITLGNGNGGTVGTISSLNSLIGSTADDTIGTDQWGNRNVHELSNGNLVVGSFRWDNGVNADAGAVTFINTTTGLTGTISSANSLVGSTANDMVGMVGTGYNIIELGNGNFVVASPDWDNIGAVDAGAVTMGNITTGISGVISAANSLVGTTVGDRVGAGPGFGDGLKAVGTNDFVVISTGWDRGGIVDAGAVTWVDGTTGRVGAVSDTNSLVGSLANDLVGSSGVITLSNGNYVVGSGFLDDGILADVGAATWGNGASGIFGSVTIANSLFGSSANDSVGIATGLASGNYVVVSSLWDDGFVADVGAVTWADGSTSLSGYVTSANSLIGTTSGDQVGSSGIRSVGVGNFLVMSQNWDNGGVVDSGAVTWLQESAGTTGVVSTANSLYSTTSDSFVGGGAFLDLNNGNYALFSMSWDNGAALDAGAVTWGSGAAGVSGAISAANSLIGSTTGDALGSYGFLSLPNGNYIINSASWDNGAIVDAGAITWGNGATGTYGVVSAQNSVVGSQAGDLVGWQDWGSSTVLSNSDYVLHAIYWDNGALADAGAVMVMDGTNGTFGEITSYNAILSSVANGGLWPNYQNNEDEINGRYVFTSYIEQKVYSIELGPHESLGTYDSYGDSAGANITLSPDFITHVLNTGTSVTLQANNDITVNNDLIVTNNFGDGGTLTFQAGRSILLNADIFTDDGDLNLFANEDLATGVVNAHRDAGAAVITMAAGAEIDVGTGSVNIRLDDGTGKTNATAGNITLRDITAGTILARNMNASGNLIVQSGVLSASDAGTAITLVSARNFINNSGAGALDATTGRWLVYSSNPALDTIGALPNDFRRFSCTYGGSCPAITGGTDNGLLYSITPLLTITPTALAAIEYGDAIPSLTGYAYGVSGYLGGDAGDDVLGGSINGSTTYTATSGVNSYNINYASGALTSDMGYGFTYANNAAGIVVGKKDITASFTTALSKTYGDINPTIDYSDFTFAGLVGSDSASLFTSVTPNFGGVDANTDVSVGNAVTAAIGATANYNVTNTPATTMSIIPRALSVTTNAASKILPAGDPVFTGSSNLTAYDAALVSWAYAPLAYAGLEGTYTIGATATDPSSRLANYTRTNTYGNFIVYPVGTVFAQPTPEMPNTVTYMSLGGFLRDIQGEGSEETTGSASAEEAKDGATLENQLVLAESEGGESDATGDRSFINIHPRLKAFLTNPFAMLMN